MAVHVRRQVLDVIDANVSAEVRRWMLDGYSDTDADPDTVLLQLVAYQRFKVNRLGQLLGEAYEAAERLKRAYALEELIDVPPEDRGERPPEAAKQAALADLRRVFALGGVAALVGHSYGATKDGDIFATGEAIRGLVVLEERATDRLTKICLGVAGKRVNEQRLQLAEQLGTDMAETIRAVMAVGNLTTAQQVAMQAEFERQMAAKWARSQAVLDG